MRMLDAGQCAVILLNYKGAADTLACLEALERLEAAPRRIIVVDNGSGEGEFARLKDGWTALAQRHGQPAPALTREGGPLPEVSHVLLALKENGGFSSGNNAGLRLAMQDERCRAFWLLNNDTEPAPDALDALCARLNERPDAGIAGSTLVYAHDPGRLQCAAGGTFTPWLAATRHHDQDGDADRLPARDATEAVLDYVIGASMLIRRKALETLNLLSEEYFLYCEDVDFCLRAKQAGFALCWAPGSLVRHREGGSSGASVANPGGRPARSPLVEYLNIRNRLFLVRRFNPSVLPIALLTMPIILVRRLWRGQADRCGLVLMAAWDALAGRMGKPSRIAGPRGDTP